MVERESTGHKTELAWAAQEAGLKAPAIDSQGAATRQGGHAGYVYITVSAQAQRLAHGLDVTEREAVEA